MDVRGASADALTGLTGELGDSLKAAEFSAVGSELFEVAQLLRSEAGLRRLVTDPSTAVAAKQGLVKQLLEGKVSSAALALVSSAAGRRWTASRDLPNALERLSEIATVRSVGKDGDTVADELFGFSQLISGDHELRGALTDPSRSVEDRRGLVSTLLGGKAHKATVALAQRAIGGGYRDPETALAEYQRVAADVRGQSVATVRVARPLSKDHAARLSAALQAKYGRPVHLNVIVDPRVVGGITVAIGDDVIDGTVSTRLAEASRRLAG